MQIRPATAADTADIQAIYAHHVLHGTGSFEEVPPSVEEMQARVDHVLANGWAWLVAEDATGVLGFACYKVWDDRGAYRHTAETSVYVRDDVRGQGVGKALVGELIPHATASGFRQMVAAIGDSDNVGSIGVHASLGFSRVGTLRAVGFKAGAWIDLVLMQRALGAGEAKPPAG